jgi:hypothetical protein
MVVGEIPCDVAVTEMKIGAQALAAAYNLGRLTVLAHACDTPIPADFKPMVEAMAALG